MSKFHISPKSGDPKPCEAQESCPYGDLDTSHYDSKEEARAAFEATQEQLPPAAKKKDRVLRVGRLEGSAPNFEDLDSLVTRFDAAAPEGRQTRRGALFASPDMASHHRWVKASGFMNHLTSESHELTVDPRTTYVYPIGVYEAASRAESLGQLEEFKRLQAEYWEQGMPLSEWRVWAANAKPTPGSWELLVPSEAAETARPVSNRRVIEAAEDERLAEELNWTLERKRAAKGLLWRKPYETKFIDGTPLPERLYHVTTKANFKKLEYRGLKPSVGERSEKLQEEKPRVYLFESREAAENALGSWMGDEFEEDEEFVLLSVPQYALKEPKPSFPDSEGSWEWTTTAPIAGRHLKVEAENF